MCSFFLNRTKTKLKVFLKTILISMQKTDIDSFNHNVM